jgi:hypothetical protein
MRKGDYREWRGGYYYSDDKHIARMRLPIHNTPNIHFHIISNEIVDIPRIKEALRTDSVTSSSNDQYIDLVTLSKMAQLYGATKCIFRRGFFHRERVFIFLVRDISIIHLSDFNCECCFRTVFNGIKK